MDREAFVAWLRHSHLPTLAAGQVVMDNLNVHKGGEVRRIIEAHGCALIGHPLGSMPAYSPDFSPIEGAHSKVKARLLRAGKQTQKEPEAAIGAVTAETASDARLVRPLRLSPPDIYRETRSSWKMSRVSLCMSFRRRTLLDMGIVLVYPPALSRRAWSGIPTDGRGGRGRRQVSE